MRTGSSGFAPWSEDLTTALLITFLVVSPRVSVQYLAWPLPFLAARTTFFATPAIVAASVFDGFGYLALGPDRVPGWMHAKMWYLTSWDVIPLLIAAMPWERRRGDDVAVSAPAGEAVIPDAALEPTGSGWPGELDDLTGTPARHPVPSPRSDEDSATRAR